MSDLIDLSQYRFARETIYTPLNPTPRAPVPQPFATSRPQAKLGGWWLFTLVVVGLAYCAFLGDKL